MIVIPLGEERTEPDPLVPGNHLIGKDSDLSPEELWERSRGHWPLRADVAGNHSHVAYQRNAKIVLVAKIGRVVASPSPNKIVFEGEPLSDEDPFARLLVGKASHWHRPHYLTDDELAQIITG